jgi:hypothetical protein
MQHRLCGAIFRYPCGFFQEKLCIIQCIIHVLASLAVIFFYFSAANTNLPVTAPAGIITFRIQFDTPEAWKTY